MTCTAALRNRAFDSCLDSSFVSVGVIHIPTGLIVVVPTTGYAVKSFFASYSKGLNQTSFLAIAATPAASEPYLYLAHSSNIRPAIAIIVKQRNSSAHRLHNELRRSGLQRIYEYRSGRTWGSRNPLHNHSHCRCRWG